MTAGLIRNESAMACGQNERERGREAYYRIPPLPLSPFLCKSSPRCPHSNMSTLGGWGSSPETLLDLPTISSFLCLSPTVSSRVFPLSLSQRMAHSAIIITLAERGGEDGRVREEMGWFFLCRRERRGGETASGKVPKGEGRRIQMAKGERSSSLLASSRREPSVPRSH